MVNATEYAKTDSITVEEIKDNDVRRLQILTEPRPNTFGKLECNVLYNGKTKTWAINKITARNLINRWGEETTNWKDKEVTLHIKEIKGKDSIIGVAFKPSEQEVSDAVVNANIR